VRVIGLDLPPRDMNVQNIVTIMMVLVENIVAMAVMAEQRKMIKGTEAYAARLSGRDSNRDQIVIYCKLLISQGSLPDCGRARAVWSGG
jgi:hypothetical protein